jgi:hypothetical protein
MTNGLYRCFSGLGLGSCFSCFNVFRRSNHNATNQDTRASASLVFVGLNNDNNESGGGVNSSPDADVEVDPNQNLEPSQSITFTNQVPTLVPLDAGPDLSELPPTIQPEKGLLSQKNDQNQAGGLILPSNARFELPVKLNPDEIAPSTPRSNADNQSSGSSNNSYWHHS